jgi:ADP-ribose pyrophosphatase YjhB (NUDIX family)
MPADPSSVVPGLLDDGVVVLRPGPASEGTLRFTVSHDGAAAGALELTALADGRARVSWQLPGAATDQGLAARALGLLVDYAFRALGVQRVEALVPPDDETQVRVATRAGLQREGLLRGHGVAEDGRSDAIVLGRLATDPPTSDPRSFRSMLNSFLPRKRAISQLLVLDPAERVLLCRLTYKNDWDLPGGVVEVNESPREAAGREVEEELALHLTAGPLLLTDWLPPWSGWDDALCLVFDGGVHDPAVLDHAVLQAREIRSVQFCTPAEVREHCTDFTARRIESALAARRAPGGPTYAESGRR